MKSKGIQNDSKPKAAVSCCNAVIRPLYEDNGYASAYREWVSSMTPTERARAIDLGVHQPMPNRLSNGEGREIEHLDHFALRLAAPGEEPVEASESPVREEALRLLRAVLANIFAPARGRTMALEAHILGLAIGWPGLDSISAVAKIHGVGRAAVSKAAVQFCRENNLPPSRYMRSEATRETHRLSNRRRGKKQ